MEKDSKVALVVGGSGSIGQAVVKELLNAGCAVAVVGRGIHSLTDLTDHPTQKAECVFYKADVTNSEQVQGCFQEVKNKFGHINFLVHTPGITPDPDTPLIDYKTEDWYATINIYLTSFFFCFRESLKVLEPNGHVLTLSSAVTRFPGDKLPPLHVGHYASVKAGLDEFCKWARREAHEHGILLSRVAPGAVDTPFHQQAPAHRRPSAVISLGDLANTIVTALMDGKELDQVIVAS